jgi:EmrB/QacA subfamily drug resistance transporter
MFVALMDMQIVNVALPTLSRQFAAPLSDVQWTVLAYLLALAVSIPASGWLGDRIGLKQTFVLALALFTLASALCGSVNSLPEMIVARALQGAGGGMLAPSGTAMLYRAYPPEQRARVSRTLIVPILIAPAAAPLLGGGLIQLLSWRWIFLVNLPVGAVTLLFAWRFLPPTRPTHNDRLDVGGLLLSAVGLSAVLYAVSEGSALGWGATQVVTSGLGGAVLLAVFVRRSLRQADPILRIRLLGDRLFRATNIVFAVTTATFIASLYLTPTFLQEVLHQSPIGSGSTTFLEAVGVAIGSQTLARLYPRLGPRVLATLGALMISVYLGLFVLVEPGTNLWLVRGLMLLGGFGNSGVFISLQTAMFTTISREDLGHASAIYNTQRQSTIALNVAMLTTIVAGSASGGVGAFHSAYIAGAILAAAGAGSAFLLIHTSDARSTMLAPDAGY